MSFDKDGMYPQHNCSDCGKSLNADGGHPAELYAGTYTGLCYDCERKPQVTMRKYTRDNALMVSCPPLCPSHRRDRETFHVYADCPDCAGVVKTEWHSGHPWGYTSYVRCTTCRERFYNAPWRKAFEWRRKVAYHAANALYFAAIKKAGVWCNVKGKNKDSEEECKRKQSIQQLIATPYYNQYKQIVDHLDRLAESRDPWEK